MLALDIIITENRAYDSAQTYRDNITQIVRGGYSFTSNILGGHTRATFNAGCSMEKAWQILTEHLGRRIIVSSPRSPYTDMSVWEGIVYEVRIDDGRTAVSRSMETVYNEVFIADYTTGVAPTINRDTASQAKWGKRDLAITTTAREGWAALRATMLANHKDPRAVQMQTRRGNGAAMPEAVVTITAAGIWELWGRRLYRSVDTTSHTVNYFITQYLNSYPNNYASSVRTYVGSNTTQRSRNTPNYTTIQTLIGQLCALGDSSFNRWQWGFYENGNPYFSAEPTTTTYRTASLDKGERIYDATTGLEVPPFLVRPGKIIEVADIMPDSITYGSHLGDPRKMVIGEVTYTSPGVLSVTPQISNPGQVRLDRLNLR